MLKTKTSTLTVLYFSETHGVTKYMDGRCFSGYIQWDIARLPNARKKNDDAPIFTLNPKYYVSPNYQASRGRSCFMRRHAQTGATRQQDKTCPGTKMKLRPLRGGARDVVDNVSCMSVLIMFICLNSSTFLPMNKNVIHHFQVPKNWIFYFFVLNKEKMSTSRSINS